MVSMFDVSSTVADCCAATAPLICVSASESSSSCSLETRFRFACASLYDSVSSCCDSSPACVSKAWIERCWSDCFSPRTLVIAEEAEQVGHLGAAGVHLGVG